MADTPEAGQSPASQSQEFVAAFVAAIAATPDEHKLRLSAAIENMAPTQQRYHMIMRSLPPMWKSIFEDVIETIGAHPGSEG